MSRIAPCLLLLVACSADPSPAPITPAVPASRPVKPQPVETYAGVITSHESKLVTAEVDGRIDQLLVQPGQRVTANTPLAILNPGEVQKALDAARGAEEASLGELRRSESQRAEAGRQLRQFRGLLRDGAVSRDQVASAQTAYVVADAQVQTARGAVTRNRASREQVEQQLAKTTIV
ncbi:MAG TPA: hypothetical protein VIV11_01625, partial [Kofleriaceae bacterium]